MEALGLKEEKRRRPRRTSGVGSQLYRCKVKIKKIDDDTDMVCLEFEIDKKVEWHLLERPRYTSSPAAAIRSWVLLEARPLHDVSSDMSVRVL